MNPDDVLDGALDERRRRITESLVSAALECNDARAVRACHPPSGLWPSGLWSWWPWPSSAPECLAVDCHIGESAREARIRADVRRLEEQCPRLKVLVTPTTQEI